jgi:t-SNARE complex subunit (syntaxin)
MQDVKAVLFGNGKLGTVRWEKITRAMAMFAILVVIVILVMVLLQGVQIAQMQQQISVIMEALP